MPRPLVGGLLTSEGQRGGTLPSWEGWREAGARRRMQKSRRCLPAILWPDAQESARMIDGDH